MQSGEQGPRRFAIAADDGNSLAAPPDKEPALEGVPPPAKADPADETSRRLRLFLFRFKTYAVLIYKKEGTIPKFSTLLSLAPL